MQVHPEYQLTAQPQRADILLVRRTDCVTKDTAQILKRLWSLVPDFAVLEFKSIVSGLVLTDWSVLYGYTHQFIARNRQTPLQAKEIATVMVVPSVTPTAFAEIERLGLLLCPLEGGYYLVEKALFPSFLVVTDEVCLAEQDPVLGIFAHKSIAKKLGPVPSTVANLVRAYLSKEDIDMAALEGTDELWERFAEDLPSNILRSQLYKLKPQERLEGLKPQERLEGLSQEELILALPDDILCLQPRELIESFSLETQELIKKRLKSI